MEEKEIVSLLQRKGYQAEMGQTIMASLEHKGSFLTPNLNAARVKVQFLTFNNNNEIIVLPLSFLGKLLPDQIYVIPFSDIDKIDFKNKIIYYKMIIKFFEQSFRKKDNYQVNKWYKDKWHNENVQRILDRFNS